MYSNKKPESTLKVFALPTKSLKDFTHDNAKYGFVNLPEDKYRKRDMEMKGTKDLEDEQKKTEEMSFTENEEDHMAQLMGAAQGKVENRFSLTKTQTASEGLTKKEADSLSEFGKDFRSSLMMKARRPSKLKLEDFEIMSQLGRGTFGRVYLAKLSSRGGQLFAIKAIRKDVLIEYDQIESTLLEKDILFQADHPFLVGMDFLFQSDTRLYFVMPFVQGGELYKIF